MRLRKKPWISQALEDYKGKELLEDGLEAYKGKWRALLAINPFTLKLAVARGSLSAKWPSFIRNAYLALKPSRDVCYYAVKKLRDQEIDNARILRLMRPICLTGSKKGKWKALPQLQRSLAQGSSCKTTPYLPQFPCSL
mgnify:CR=1 FL=1